MTDHGLSWRRQDVEQGFFDFESGRHCARKLLDGRSRPTAIFASNDDMAAGVLFEAHQQGLRVPDQLSVTGFNDTPVARQIWPALIREMASLSSQLLIETLRDPSAAGTHEPLRCSLRIRQSTRPAPT